MHLDGLHCRKVEVNRSVVAVEMNWLFEVKEILYIFFIIHILTCNYHTDVYTYKTQKNSISKFYKSGTLMLIFM